MTLHVFMHNHDAHNRHSCARMFNATWMSVGAQADNAGGENKNQWMMRYLSLLIDRGCFRSTCLATLQVGHTHEDIDAIFGIMSTEIAKTLDWDSPMAMAECLGRRTRASVGDGNEMHTCITTLQFSGTSYRPHCPVQDRPAENREPLAPASRRIWLARPRP